MKKAYYAIGGCDIGPVGHGYASLVGGTDRILFMH
jgi:hypothetical protein